MIKTINIQGIEMEVSYTGLVIPFWGNGVKCDCYSITLTNVATQEIFNFSYFDSITNTEYRVAMDKPTGENDHHHLSQVLECIYNDLCCAEDCDTFKDCCDNFGTNIDSIKDMEEYNKIKTHMDALVRVTEGTKFMEALYLYLHEEDDFEVGLALNPAQSFDSGFVKRMETAISEILNESRAEEPVESDWRADYQRYVDGDRK